jgi:hypothetical protein
MEAEPAFETWHSKKSKDGQSPKKRRLCQLTLVMLCSLFFTLDDFAVRALVCLCMGWLIVSRVGAVRFSASYTNLR